MSLPAIKDKNLKDFSVEPKGKTKKPDLDLNDLFFKALKGMEMGPGYEVKKTTEKNCKRLF